MRSPPGSAPTTPSCALPPARSSHLNREELQGVIGHEFSHLLNGDSRLNLRLIALLNGILFLGIVGRLLLRGGANTSGRRDSNAMPLIVLGVGLFVIGYAGTFCGNLIKAAVSRQREFLADAASVQFTRNPHGIANALKKIGGSVERLAPDEHTRQRSEPHVLRPGRHAVHERSLMATHPPLPLRIRAIEPRWDGKFLEGAPVTDADRCARRADGIFASAFVTPRARSSRGFRRQPDRGEPDAGADDDRRSSPRVASRRRTIRGRRARSSTCCCCPTIAPARAALTDVLEPQVVAHLPQIEARDRRARRHAAVDAGVDVGAGAVDDVAPAIRPLRCRRRRADPRRPAHRSVRMGHASRVAEGPEVAFRRAAIASPCGIAISTQCAIRLRRRCRRSRAPVATMPRRNSAHSPPVPPPWNSTCSSSPTTIRTSRD